MPSRSGKQPLTPARILLMAVIAIGGAIYKGVLGDGSGSSPSAGSPVNSGSPGTVSTSDGVAAITEAAATQRSGFMVEASGSVKKSLPDDLEGSRHQRFIVRLANGHTVLIAHNIDLAPKVPLREGDTLEFRGQYEWNPDGGVVHWTHHDPDGRHDEGWIRHAGELYE